MKTKLGWKVVRKLPGGKLQSSHVTNNEYRIGRWTEDRPVGYGPLSVFTTRRAARDFKGWSTQRIYRCRYEPSPCTAVWSPGNGGRLLNDLPSGKALAERVMLLWRD